MIAIRRHVATPGKLPGQFGICCIINSSIMIIIIIIITTTNAQMVSLIFHGVMVAALPGMSQLLTL